MNRAFPLPEAEGISTRAFLVSATLVLAMWSALLFGSAYLLGRGWTQGVKDAWGEPSYEEASSWRENPEAAE